MSPTIEQVEELERDGPASEEALQLMRDDGKHSEEDIAAIRRRIDAVLALCAFWREHQHPCKCETCSGEGFVYVFGQQSDCPTCHGMERKLPKYRGDET